MKLQQLADQLESFVDKHGMTAILEALALICSSKADHVSSSWQDPETASRWDTAAARLLQLEYGLFR